MTVPEQIPVVNYVADGIVKKFDVPFEYDQQSDLHIYVDGVEPTIDKYYFDDNAFNFYIAPTAGQDVKIKRITPKERDTDYNLHTNTVRPKALNTDFDRLWYVLQEVFSDVGGLSQAVQDEIIARIQGDEDLLNQLTAEISARMLGDEAITEDLKNYIDNMIALIIGDPSFNGIDADKVNDASGEAQQQVNYNGGSKWHSRVGGYKLNERAALNNGDIVKSTIDGNTNDPNVDMTGWVKINSASQIFDESGKSQQEINDLFGNRDVFIDDYYAGSGSLRPVSDLYTIGSSVYNEKFTDFASVQLFLTAATSPTDPLDWAAAQTAVDNNRSVRMLPKFYYFGTKTLQIPTTCAQFIGSGILNRIYTDAEIGIKAKDGNRIVQGTYGDFYLLGSNVLNSKGFDASGFSYNTIKNIYIRQFNAGWYADGSTTPVNKQYSNNTVINVRSNNNLDRGFKFVGSSEANSANIYIGCESAGNVRGWDEQVGYSNQMIGCTLQGNSELDFYSNGQRNIYQYYAEGIAKSSKLGPLSRETTVSIRSSYPLWNSFINEGVGNNISVRGDIDVDQHVFFNPYSENWTTTNPVNILPNGAPVFSWFSDANIPKGGGLQVSFNANFQGIILQGLDASLDFSGRWVTVEIDADTSGVTDLGGLRVHTRDGSTNNGATGEFAVSSFTNTATGKYKKFVFDVKFANTVSGIPSILIYLAYSGITTSNIIKIKSIKVILGQKDRVSDYSLSSLPVNAVGTSFTSATSGLNIAWKRQGRFVFNTTVGKIYYATGTTPTSAWKSVDGTADIIPS